MTRDVFYANRKPFPGPIGRVSPKEQSKQIGDTLSFGVKDVPKNEVYSFMGTQPQYDDITLVGMEGQA